MGSLADIKPHRAAEGGIQASVIMALGQGYERSEDLEQICRSLQRVLGPLVNRYEVIVVDDAAGPKAKAKLRQLEERIQEARIIRLRRGVGEAAALAIGARAAHGQTLITLDPYLHVAVDELPKLLDALRNGTDLVCAWRVARKDSAVSRLSSQAFNALARWLTGVSTHDLNCRTRVMRREVIEEMPLYGDLHRFLPIFAARRGYRVCEVQVPQQPGKREVGAYVARNYVRRLLDLLTLVFLTRFVRRPLQFFGLIGLASFAVGAVISLYLSYVKLILGEGIGHRPLLLLGILLIVVGIQVTSIGLLGEILIFTHARELKDYVVDETLSSAP